MTEVRQKIEKILFDALTPTLLQVEDQSHRHVGHAGAKPGGQTHFELRIVSPLFAGQSRVERQRRVYELLAPLMNNPIHALAMTTQTPDEAGKTQFSSGSV